MTYALAAVAAFLTIMAKVFQQKNVVGNHYKAAFVTSMVLSVLEASIVLLVVAEGLEVAIFSGIGAAFGGISGMALHSRMVGKNKAVR